MGWKQTKTISRADAIEELVDLQLEKARTILLKTWEECSNETISQELHRNFGYAPDGAHYGWNFQVIE